jgi:hypothetical protein
MPSMIVSQKLIPTLKKVMFTATAVFALMQCSEDEEFLTPPVASDATVEAASTTAPALSVSSLTVTGINTAYATVKDCKTCTYVVSADEQIIDGNALGIKPGNIICLNKGVEYGNLEFVNIEGSVESPVIIATVGERVSLSDNSSPADPY